MSDKKLNECRAERDRLRIQVEGLNKLLEMPEHRAVKVLHFERRRDHAVIEKLKQRTKRLKDSNASLHSQLDPLRQSLKTERARTELLEGQLQEIRDWLRDNGHPIVMGESFLEKLANMQTIIDSSRNQLVVLDYMLKKNEPFREAFKKALDQQKTDPNPLGLASKIGGA
jgi:chromosome segregation ATPase